MEEDFTLRNFLKDLGFGFLMAGACIAVFAVLAFTGDIFDIEILQSTNGILGVLFVGGPLVLISLLVLLYLTDAV